MSPITNDFKIKTDRQTNQLLTILLKYRKSKPVYYDIDPEIILQKEIIS